jgi:hypothetical protein
MENGKNGLHILENGTVIWYKNGLAHRVGNPAIIGTKGATEWLQDGKYHRVDGPAVEYSTGGKEWWLNDELVYDKFDNYLHNFPKLSRKFKQSIVKFRLTL